MSIIDAHHGAPPHTRFGIVRRLFWFVLIWGASTAAFIAAASALHMLIPH